MTFSPFPEHRQHGYFLSCLLLLPVLAFIGVASVYHPTKHARAGIANSLMAQLEQATKMYQLDYAVFPPGDGSGTAELMRCLARSYKRNGAYFEFPRKDLSPAGDLPNPVDPDKIVHYRCPGLHRPMTFDLWCEDADGRPEGVNNWEKR